jgi:hypothetical protein
MACRHALVAAPLLVGLVTIVGGCASETSEPSEPPRGNLSVTFGNIEVDPTRTLFVVSDGEEEVLVDQTLRHAGASLSPDGKKLAKVLLLDPRPRTPVTASIVFVDVP